MKEKKTYENYPCIDKEVEPKNMKRKGTGTRKVVRIASSLLTPLLLSVLKQDLQSLFIHTGEQQIGESRILITFHSIFLTFKNKLLFTLNK